MIKATKKWLAIKISSGLLIPFMAWFLINFVSLFDVNNSKLIGFFSNISTKIILEISTLPVFFITIE